jgi:hypothetical protein
MYTKCLSDQITNALHCGSIREIVDNTVSLNAYWLNNAICEKKISFGVQRTKAKKTKLKDESKTYANNTKAKIELKCVNR